MDYKTGQFFIVDRIYTLHEANETSGPWASPPKSAVASALGSVLEVAVGAAGVTADAVVQNPQLVSGSSSSGSSSVSYTHLTLPTIYSV